MLRDTLMRFHSARCGGSAARQSCFSRRRARPFPTSWHASTRMDSFLGRPRRTRAARCRTPAISAEKAMREYSRAAFSSAVATSENEARATLHSLLSAPDLSAPRSTAGKNFAAGKRDGNITDDRRATRLYRRRIGARKCGARVLAERVVARRGAFAKRGRFGRERCALAAMNCARRGARRVVLIGCDIPDLPPQIIAVGVCSP